MDEATKETLSAAAESTIEATEKAIRHPYIIKLAKLGFYTKGFLFIVIGILAVLVAIGDRSGELTDPTGALTAVALAPFGKVILVIFIIGAIGHGAWNIARGIIDLDNAGKNLQGITKRIIAIGVGIFYWILAWSAWDIVTTVQIAIENGAMQKNLTMFLLALPIIGVVLVFFIGLGVIIAGVHECYSGLTGKFRESFRQHEISSFSRRMIVILGVLSFTARALIFGLMGYFFIAAAIEYNPNEVVGVDGALLILAQSRFGKSLLFFAATGLICHGILSLYEAKYRRIC